MYLLIYLANKTLPWADVNESNFKKKFKAIKYLKKNLAPEKIATHNASNKYYKHFIAPFTQLLTYCLELRFEEKPDYEFVREELR